MLKQYSFISIFELSISLFFHLYTVKLNRQLHEFLALSTTLSNENVHKKNTASYNPQTFFYFGSNCQFLKVGHYIMKDTIQSGTNPQLPTLIFLQVPFK